MGVVYKAEDERLQREVALKVMRSFGADGSKRDRFWQEVRVAAQVVHPNACRIYDVVEDHECPVLVMEYIEGEPLCNRIQRGPLPAQEAAQIVLATLSALEALHKQGIVHRDLKPANIVLSDSGTKLLDFGIAKQLQSHAPENVGGSTQTGVTLPGVFVGTPKYASPEQFRGHPVDPRSDLFSTGAILFEMLTGSPPFAGESFGELAHSVLRGAPPAISGSPAIAAMGRVVHRALDTDPDGRYASAEAMAAELRATLLLDGIENRAEAQTLRRILVLPFRVLRPSEDIQFLANSLPEAITVSLMGLENLLVRSSLIASRYSGETLDLQKIAKEAEVDIVLTGTLLNVGEQLRITTQLAEVPSGTLLWSHTAQARTNELLELHDDLVRRVVNSILPSLSAQESQALQQDRPADPGVYQLYLQANDFGREWATLPTAIELYERCVRLDASFAPAWARLGRARWLLDKYEMASEEGLKAADEAIRTALRLNPNLTLAHNLYTSLQVDQGRTIEAMKRLLDRAHHRRSDAELFAGLGHVCRYCGLLQAALAAHKEARRLDPQIPTSMNHTYMLLGDYQRALDASGGDFGYGHALALGELGRTEEAISTLRRRELMKPPRLGKLYLTSLRALLEGNTQESVAATEELRAATFRDPEGMYYQSRQLSYLGHKAAALDMLSRSIHNGFFCYPALVRDPWLDPLRSKTEFTALLRKAHQLHREAAACFIAGGGDTLLGIGAKGD